MFTVKEGFWIFSFFSELTGFPPVKNMSHSSWRHKNFFSSYVTAVQVFLSVSQRALASACRLTALAIAALCKSSSCKKRLCLIYPALSDVPLVVRCPWVSPYDLVSHYNFCSEVSMHCPWHLGWGTCPYKRTMEKSLIAYKLPQTVLKALVHTLIFSLWMPELEIAWNRVAL